MSLHSRTVVRLSHLFCDFVLKVRKRARRKTGQEDTEDTEEGAAATAGIGFTVSLFIAGLAFSDPLLTEAKIGIVGASLVAAVIGSSILLRAKEVEEIETDDPMLVGTASP